MIASSDLSVSFKDAADLIVFTLNHAFVYIHIQPYPVREETSNRPPIHLSQNAKSYQNILVLQQKNVSFPAFVFFSSIKEYPIHHIYMYQL